MKKIIILLCFCLTFSFSNAQDLSVLFGKVSSSVVQIQTKEKEIVGSGKTRQTVTAQGIGSGVLISADGLILTAAHVVQTAEDVKVIFNNNEVIPAKIIATEPTADVALIKLVWPPTYKNLHIPKVADSDKVKTGEQIFVVGSPYGLAQSLSSGYISGMHEKKSISHKMTLMQFFQTDAAINTGNSGGPMFNMKGEVVGIVSYILSESGGFQGLGFAATSNMATNLLLDNKGMWFGLDAVLVSGEMAKIFNLPQGGGILIQKVVDLSPGGIMGLQGGRLKMEFDNQKYTVGGDIILTILGDKVENQKDVIDLQLKIKNLKEKDIMKLTVMRAGKIIELNYTLPKK